VRAQATSSIRRLPATLSVLALLSAGAVACGTTTTAYKHSNQTATTATEATSTTVVGGYLRNDGDYDYDDAAHNRGNAEYDAQSLFKPYNGPVRTPDRHAIVSLVRGYIAAAATGNATNACSLLTADLIAGLQTSQSQPASANENCAASLTPLLRRQHRYLVTADPATMLVTSVHEKGSLAVASLGFKKTFESEIQVEREGHRWKIAGLFPGLMP